jgi:hypothetical protein
MVAEKFFAKSAIGWTVIRRNQLKTSGFNQSRAENRNRALSLSCGTGKPQLMRLPQKTLEKTNMKTEIKNENANLLAASIQDEIRQAKDQAADLGEHAGKNAASEFLRAFDDGDEMPEPPNLSGEWADSETPVSLMCAVFGDNWEETPEFVDAQDEVCAAWEIAAQDAFYSALCQSAQSILE